MGVPDVPRHLIRNGCQEPLHFPALPLSHQMHAAVRQIADEPRHLKVAGEVASVPAKTDALHLAGIIDFAADGT